MTDILRLPHPGTVARVETGVVQFGDDWPGVFIRGDNALTVAHMLREALKLIPQTEWLVRSQLKGLHDDLQSCSVGDTGWPPTKEEVTDAAVRDHWVGRFERRRQELIDGGMTFEQADTQAARDVRAQLRDE